MNFCDSKKYYRNLKYLSNIFLFNFLNIFINNIELKGVIWKGYVA